MFSKPPQPAPMQAEQKNQNLKTVVELQAEVIRRASEQTSHRSSAKGLDRTATWQSTKAYNGSALRELNLAYAFQRNETFGHVAYGEIEGPTTRDMTGGEWAQLRRNVAKHLLKTERPSGAEVDAIANKVAEWMTGSMSSSTVA